MTSSSTPKSPERILRECDCPPYAEMCAHLPQGVRIWLLSVKGAREESVRRNFTTDNRCPECGARPMAGVNEGWAVFAGVHEPPHCACRVPLSLYPGTPEWALKEEGLLERLILDYDQALAAFYDAEARLLRGEA